MSSRAVRGPLRFNTTTTVTATPCVVGNESVILVNQTVAGACAITLPAPSTVTGGKRVVIVQDMLGDAGTNAITVTPASGLINGAANYVINGNYGAAAFMDNGVGWNVVWTSTPQTSGTVTVNQIVSGDSQLDINGQAAAQGGAVKITGGTSSTSANAGGALTFTGGTPGLTGIGGAVNSVGGAGGATSGAGGAVNSTSGASSNATTTVASASGGITLAIGTTGTATTGTGGLGGTIALTGVAGGAASGAAGIGGAGSPITLLCGAGGATASATSGISGVGGAVAITAGAGGACAHTGAQASAAGGAVTITAGASGTVAGSTQAATGGLAKLVGGAGGASSSTGAGGIGGGAQLTAAVGGAGSATGTGGAGGSVTVTAGAGGATSGAGTGGAAGNINFVPAAGGTAPGGTAGAAGAVQVNGKGFIILTHVYDVLGNATDCHIWQNPTTNAQTYRVRGGSARPRVLDGAAKTANIMKCSSTQAPSAGTALFTATVDLNTGADTVQNLTVSATPAALLIAAGDSIAIDFSNTLMNGTGVISVVLEPMG